MAQHQCTRCGTPHTASPACDDHDHGPEEFVVENADHLTLLNYLGELREDRKTLDNDERLVVERLRALEVSWAKIAYRLDVPKSTLHQRYGYLT